VHTVWTVVLVIHLVAMAGMVVTAAVQLARFPFGPLKRLKWVWLPTVGTTVGTGLLLMLVSSAAGMSYDVGKALVKIVVAALAVVLAARFHTAEREQTPPWVPSVLAVFVVTDLGLSLLWT
jgi:hypothetical protein